ncbi:response regulator transcription factor [Bacillus salipaludis]|uniref:Response regulator transcription factor n=1 Tax=Bacillus salipaludis TaxID=2547811 RepID=A0A4R5VKK1_9BACI|nr:response regulator transcription factor [Bacillus salipaludis]
MSINTVKSHLNNIFNKLNVNNRTAVLHKITSLI